jgi:hypothetical protein
VTQTALKIAAEYFLRKPANTKISLRNVLNGSRKHENPVEMPI